MSTATTRRALYTSEAVEITPAPLVFALSLLAVAGMLMLPAGEVGAPAMQTAPPVVSEITPASAVPAIAAAEPPAPAPVNAEAATPAAVAAPDAPVVDISKLPQVILRLDAAGSVTYKDEVITEDDVVTDLAGEPRSIIIRAEVGAPVPQLVELMRWLKKAGIQYTAVEPVKAGS